MVDLVFGHEISMCFGQCLPVEREDFTTSEYTLQPNEITAEGFCSIHLYPYMKLNDIPTYTLPVAGTSKINVIFENSNNPNDRTEYLITYNVQPNTAVEISNNSDLEILEITPNPAVGETQLKYTMPKDNEVTYLEIYDLSGNMVINKDLYESANSVFINTSNLSSGSYYCRLISGSSYKSKVKYLIVKK
jgi:hypothetical protein